MSPSESLLQIPAPFFRPMSQGLITTLSFTQSGGRSDMGRWKLQIRKTSIVIVIVAVKYLCNGCKNMCDVKHNKELSTRVSFVDRNKRGDKRVERTSRHKHPRSCDSMADYNENEANMTDECDCTTMCNNSIVQVVTQSCRL